MVAVSVAVVLLAASARGQVQVPRVDEIIEVRIINFDVVVTDAEGNPVRGLTRDDFELYEDGKRQEITNFSEVSVERAQAATSQPAPRRVVIFVDVVSTTTFERKRACAALAGFIEKLGPDDEAMVVAWNRQLRIVVPATHDHAALRKGLDAVARELGPQRRADTLLGDGQRMTAPEARTMRRQQAKSELNDLQQTAAAVNAVLTRLSGLDGRKALILLTKGFALRVQEDDAAPAEEDLDAANVMKSITRSANAAGVTLYGMHAAGTDSGMSVEDTDPGATETRARRSSASVDGLRLLAGQTGGSVMANTNTFERALDRVAQDLSSYYSIGYRAHARRTTGEKEVSIRTRERRYRVRSRRMLVERSFDEEIAYRLVSTLFFPASSNDLRITAGAAPAARQKRNRYAVALDVEIPYENLVFTPEGGDNVADLSIYIGSVDERGSMSEVKRFDEKVRVPREKFASISGRRYRYGFDVDLRAVAGEHRIAVAVIDNLSKMTGFAVVELGKLPGR